MSTKRTAALAVGVAILIGGGATALAATSDGPARPTFEAVAPASEARSIHSAVAEAETVIDTETAESVESATGTEPAPAPADTVAPEPAPATTTPQRSEGSEDSADDAGSSSRLAGPGGSFATMPIKPPDWNGFDDEAIDNPDYPDYPYYPDDPAYTDHGPYDGPGLPFELNGINLEKLTSLARSVGIEVGVPVFGDDGSITVEVTLPDGTAHAVWVATDADQHITDATVDGVPVMEFVRQFLAGEVGRPASPSQEHPEWNLED